VHNVDVGMTIKVDVLSDKDERSGILRGSAIYLIPVNYSVLLIDRLDRKSSWTIGLSSSDHPPDDECGRVPMAERVDIGVSDLAPVDLHGLSFRVERHEVFIEVVGIRLEFGDGLTNLIVDQLVQCQESVDRNPGV
jgi:hypothetical protein